MAAIADGVAALFQQFSPLKAYRLDILGSLLGISVFSLCSFMHATPLCCSIIISVVFASVLVKDWRVNYLVTVLQRLH